MDQPSTLGISTRLKTGVVDSGAILRNHSNFSVSPVTAVSRSFRVISLLFRPFTGDGYAGLDSVRVCKRPNLSHHRTRDNGVRGYL